MISGAQLEDEINQLVAEVEDINGILYDLAQDSTTRGNIKLERVDWQIVDEVDEKYEIWYTQAFTLVSDYVPERRADFEQAYSDMDELLHFDSMEYKAADKYCGILRRIISRQKNILLSIPPKLETERLKVRKGVSDDIITEELHQSKRLWDEDNIRAAGIVAGVALERHLLTLCETSEQDMTYEHSDGIRSLTETLYDAGMISQTKKGQLEHLADVRNDCAHANEEEPDRREVERLINQAENIVREL